MNDGSTTSATASGIGITRPRMPMEIVGSPPPMTPLMKPASAKVAAMRERTNGVNTALYA